MHIEQAHLFSDRSFSEYSHQILQGIEASVNKIPKDQFMVSSESELVEHQVLQLALESLAWYPDKASMHQSETRMDVLDWGEVINVPGTQVVVDIPVTGTDLLWKFRPNTYDFNPPVASLSQGKGVRQILGNFTISRLDICFPSLSVSIICFNNISRRTGHGQHQPTQGKA